MQPTPSASATLVTYQPQLLVAAKAPHGNQRYPANHPFDVAHAAPTAHAKGRKATIFRFQNERHAMVGITDRCLDISIELDADGLRRLAFQLLDAAHDIEHAHTELEQAE